MFDSFNLSAFSVPDTTGNMPLSYGFGNIPSITYGSAKVIARITQLLLTKKGSDRTDPNAGCHLLDLVGSCHTSERSFLQGEINRILDDVSFQMLNENDPTVIPESRFVSAECENLEIDQDVVRLHITVTVASREPLKFVLPITLL